MVIKENMHSAKTHLSRLVKRALEGDEVIIAKSGKPLVTLVPITDSGKDERRPGSAKGLFVIGEDFDQPLSEEELGDWGL